jgi:hypothetical protein
MEFSTPAMALSSCPTLAANRQVCLSFVIDVGSIGSDIRPHHREGGLHARNRHHADHGGVMGDGRLPRMIYTIVSGEVYHSLGLLRRLVALAMDVDIRWVDPEHIRSYLQAFPIRSRFPIFIHAPFGNAQWTAHVVVSNALNSSATSSEAGQARREAASAVLTRWSEWGPPCCLGPTGRRVLASTRSLL